MKTENGVKSENKFEFIQIEETIIDEEFEGEAIGFFQDAMIRFRKNKASVVSFIIISIIIVMSIIGPMMNEYDFKQQNLKLALMPARIPGLEKLGIFDGTKKINVRKTSIEEKYKDSLIEIEKEYRVGNTDMATIKVDMYKHRGVKDKYFWFGTDSLGRDQWTRLWRGTRISLIIAVLSMSINIIIGVIYGAVSGYYGGVVDLVLQRISEILGGIPLMVIVILFVIYYGPGIVPIALALCLTGWIGMSRMIRAQFFKYREMEYVLAARTLGASDRTLIFRHILPNAIGIIITMSALAIPGAIFSESFLAYVGLGIQAPEPSIGVLLAEGQQVLLEYPHLTLFPALTISILMISFNLLGNGLRDAFDPTLRGQE
ncbi:oligopeptide transport system permease protein [Keratinibaculum paraultunense]|uniref:Oligopeptide transport system permease protein n=1 Tax=Keratinibaculum paraultunense TaxID=1278232 RepID=A0A4R3KTU6_9FIRM|nr:ABC transporter permease [Keratinibaculum paraultunense]QQY79883.1 ABC transporter permease [Keratinibaculum paraultunense]TCS88769.1 oligopeptide transport system permease protein [Keratinibaculum paraultunense]